MSGRIQIRINQEMKRLIREIGERQLEEEFIPDSSGGRGAQRTKWEPGLFTWALRRYKEEQATLEDQIRQRKDELENMKQEVKQLERQKEKRDLRREKNEIEAQAHALRDRVEELEAEEFKTREEVRQQHIDKLLNSGDWESKAELLDAKSEEVEETVDMIHDPKTDKRQELEQKKTRLKELDNRLEQVKEDLGNLD